MNEQDHLKTLSEIKQLMERSSRFLSLSGLSSICIGIYALVGAAVGYWYLQDQSLDLNSYFKQFEIASEESTHSITVFNNRRLVGFTAVHSKHLPIYPTAG